MCVSISAELVKKFLYMLLSSINRVRLAASFSRTNKKLVRHPSISEGYSETFKSLTLDEFCSDLNIGMAGLILI